MSSSNKNADPASLDPSADSVPLIETDQPSSMAEELEEALEDVQETIDTGLERLDLSEKELSELLAIVRDALAFAPPLYVNAILGHPWSWLPPHDRYSEFSIIDTREVMRSIKYLVDITVPALPIQMPANLPGIGTSVFWRPTRVLFQPDGEDNPYSYPDEAWIFINGVGTNPSLARINAELIVSMFHRPLTIIQNATDSIGFDLVEAVIGKAWSVMTEAAAKAYPFIHHALHNEQKERVVVLCHSQGTIIMANVLRALIDDESRERLNMAAERFKDDDAPELKSLQDPELLHKLEIYTFANCADCMPYAPGLITERGNPAPWIENFGNEYDLVARLGILAPRPEKHAIHIDGGAYIKQGKWGHCLNLHYLLGIDQHLRQPSRANPYQLRPSADDSASDFATRPRLYGYYGGAAPDCY